MRWVVPVILLLAGSQAWGNPPQTTVAGKVVAVPDAGSVWVYLESAQASYHFELSGIPAASDPQPNQSVRDALARWILNREVRVRVQQLTDDRMVPAELFVDGQSVNQRLACQLAGGAPMPAAPSRQPSVRRPLLALLRAPLRWIPIWSDSHTREF